MPKPKIDLSFARYVAARKDEAGARAREGAAYAYAGDRRVRATFDRVRPVMLAVEAAVRFWQTAGRNRLLGNAVRVGERQFPHIHNLVRRCADTLQIALPAVYVSPAVGSLGASTFGTADDATVVIDGALIDHLSEPELLSVVGHQCGHIQNGHAVFMTTLYFLQTAGNLLVRWAARPAVLALRGWARRAAITCDRASLLCTRDLDTSTAALVKLAVGSRKLYSDINVEEYLRQLDDGHSGPGRFDELFSSHPYLPKRVQALRLFARTTFYRSAAGQVSPPAGAPPALTMEECDAQVGALLAVLK